MNGAESINKIALGTVQFGLPYGIANKSGQVQAPEAAMLVSAARSAGIDTLDTAIAYGESEAVLGSVDLTGFNIVSKLPTMPETVSDVAAWVLEQFEGSLRRLGTSTLHGLLLHRPEQLLSSRGEELYAALRRLREQGRVTKIGVSVYAPEELDAFEGKMAFDLVQAPFNVVDRRLEQSGWLAKLNGRGIEVHVRSAFMQGLLLMEPETRPTKFDRWSEIWTDWHQWLKFSGLSPLQACLQFCMGFAEIDRVIVGVDDTQQLRQIIAAADSRPVSVPGSLASQDIQLLNPSLWSHL